MDLFASWYSKDPEYSWVDPECKVLVSPTSVPKSWTVCEFLTRPKEIMVDSGSFHYIDVSENKLIKTQKEVFENQLKILNGFAPAIMCHLDFAIPRNCVSKSQMNERIEITIENAEKFYDLFLKNADRLKGVEPLSVIQGYDIESARYCALKLRDIGFNRFGIGSVARLSRIKRNEILARVAEIRRIVKNLHVFGVTSVRIMKEFQRIGVSSIDSSTPIKEAIYSGIIYSCPFRRYKIGTPHFKENWSKKYGYAKILDNAMPCDCPVCRNFGSHILMLRGKKSWNNFRALHNYYHLKKELCGGIANLFGNHRPSKNTRDQHEILHTRMG
jgi:tRNA-guanine family transglycosylase